MQKLLVIIASVVVVFVILIFAAQASYQTVTVDVSGLGFRMLVADSGYKQSHGLSARALEDLEADGMIFLYDSAEERTFWMKGMEFDLDIVWVKDGKVVKIAENVPAPDAGEEPQSMSSSPFEVDMVLEFPAGTVQKRDILSGYRVNLPES